MNTHRCPKCGTEIVCTAVHRKGTGRQIPLGIKSEMKPKHYIVLSVLQEKPTELKTTYDILDFLTQNHISRPVRRRDARQEWTWNSVASALSDLVGQFVLVEMKQPEDGSLTKAWHYRTLIQTEVPSEILQRWRAGKA